MRRFASLGCSAGGRYPIWAFLLATAGCANTSLAAGALPRTSHVWFQAKATTHSTAGDRSPGRTQERMLLSDSAAKPATVTLKNETLTVEASNSDLNQILKNVADISGMIIEGSMKSARVYGIYGPGNPSEVLTSLLVGSGYNFMMVGLTAEGAPRKLLLTLQSGDSTTSAAPTPTRAEPGEDKDAAEDHLGPGALEHVPPPPSENPDERMQQNLKRLEQMRNPPKPQ